MLYSGFVNLPVVQLVVLLCLSLNAAAGWAEEIYMTTDDNGVTSFTDFPVSGAQIIDVDPIAADPEQAATSQALIDQQLSVANALEESRLAREKARTERLAALAASQPQTIYYPVERDIGYWGSPAYGYWPGYPGNRPGYRPPGFRPPGFRPPAFRPPGHRPPVPEHPMEPGGPGQPGQAPSQSRPMPSQR